MRAVLERHGLAAHRDRGQNFLTSREIAERLVTHAGVSADDAVIEIGPGLGILTRALAARAARVVALEIDAGLVRVLQQDAALPSNVALQHVDALDVDLAALARSLGTRVRVVANLPYAVSSPTLRRLLDARAALLDWSVMLQREVAERVLAAPGEPGYGSLAVLHGLTVTASRGIELAPSDFFPAPRVRSRFFRLTPRRGDAPHDDGRTTTDLTTRRCCASSARCTCGVRSTPQTALETLRGGQRPLSADAVLRALAACGIDPARVRSARAGCLPAIARALGSALDGWEAHALLDALVDCALSEGFRAASSRRIGCRGADTAAVSGDCAIAPSSCWWRATLEDRIDVVACALAALGAAWLDDCFLAPAVRERIEQRLPASANPAPPGERMRWEKA